MPSAADVYQSNKRRQIPSYRQNAFIQRLVCLFYNITIKEWLPHGCSVQTKAID